MAALKLLIFNNGVHANKCPADLDFDHLYIYTSHNISIKYYNEIFAHF